MGNYSQNPEEVLAKARRSNYVGVRFQQGKPILDRELNLLADLANPQRLAQHYIGNGVPDGDSGFQITDLNLENAPHNFTIKAGRCLVNGNEVVLAADTTYQNQPNKRNVSKHLSLADVPVPQGSTPLSIPTLRLVSLHVTTREVSETEDPDLKNGTDVGFETTVREKLDWEVVVTSWEVSGPDYFPLAQFDLLKRDGAITDLRITGLTLAKLREDITANMVTGGGDLSVRSLTVSNKAGIGTTDPGEKLQVDAGSIFVNGEGTGLIVDSGNQKRVGLMKYLGREAGVWRLSNQDFEIGRVDDSINALPGRPRSWTTDLYVAGGGNVGIGTTDPKAKLEVNGDLIVQGDITVKGKANIVGIQPSGGGGTDTGDLGRVMKVIGDNVAVGGSLEVFERLIVDKDILVLGEGNFQAAGQEARLNLGNTDHYIRAVKNAGLRIGTSGAVDGITMLESGNVGIGTTDPGSSKLKVANSANDFLDVRFDRDGTAGQLLMVAWESGWNIDAMTDGKHLYINRDAGEKSDLFIGRRDKELFVRGKDGNVGIGTANPTERLDVRSSAPDAVVNMRIANSDASCFLNFYPGKTGDAAAAIMWKSTMPLRFATTSSINATVASDFVERVRITGDGNVGIGTTDPGKNRLRISRQIGSDDASAFQHEYQLEIRNGIGNRALAIGLLDGGQGVLQVKEVNVVSGYKDLLLNPVSGNVGIGTTTPRAPLDVGIGKPMPDFPVEDQFAFLAYRFNRDRGNDLVLELSPRFGSRFTFDNTSICAAGRVVAQQFNAFSDARIKKNLRASDSTDDLSLLKQLRVTDYQFKDFLAHGNQSNKGFIAEEVEQFFPQAVSTRSDFIPDIYALAEKTTLDDDVLTVSLTDAHNLDAGDTVRLITEADGVKEVSVTIVDEKTFAIDNWQGSAGKLFVHGKKVDDFRTLDYQQIFSLGISAMQQLSNEVDDLKAANDALMKRLQLLESRLETVPSVTAANKGSHGNGRH